MKTLIVTTVEGAEIRAELDDGDVIVVDVIETTWLCVEDEE